MMDGWDWDGWLSMVIGLLKVRAILIQVQIDKSSLFSFSSFTLISHQRVAKGLCLMHPPVHNVEWRSHHRFESLSNKILKAAFVKRGM